MANLDLIKSLNQQYGKQSPIISESKLFSINEAIDPGKLEKALTDSLATMGPAYSGYFDFGLPANIAMLYIDVCGFSTRFGNLNGEEIATFFDSYYDIVIPLIYHYHGEVDKIIGDGIVCIFGPPFLSSDINDNIIRANTCAKEIIKATKKTKYSSKIAFHCGKINYFKNKSGLYKEFTMIGKPVTEIFRLESISIEERINYFDETLIRTYYQSKLKNLLATRPGENAEWLHNEHRVPDLKGINFKVFHSIRHNQ